MSSDFKELNIDRTILKEKINTFWMMNNCQEGKYSEDKPSLHRVEYLQDGCKVMVDLYFVNNGTTTINTKVGKNQAKGEELAIYLRSELVADQRKSINLTVKNIDRDIFDLLVTFFREVESKDFNEAVVFISQHQEDQSRRIFKANSIYKDSLTLTHFQTNNTLLIQGKPLYLYNQACYFLSDYTDLKGFFDIVSKGEELPNTIDVDKQVIENNLKSLMPNAYSRVGIGILKMIQTSYTLKDISIPLDDYSCYVFPVLRALEGVIRKILLEECEYSTQDNNNSFSKVFYFNSQQSYYFIHDDFKQQINDIKICGRLEPCYNYFSEQRHSLFHANDATDTSRFIATKEDAGRIIEKVIKTIEKAYLKPD
jgi:RNase LS, bacterial toxin DBD domain/RNase LS, bacterial toxin N-terminal/RNase LS, bacterial toxin